MTQVTGGTVSVEDCKKHDGYPDPQFAPTRKVRVELIFVVDTGDDAQAFLDKTSAQANTKVAELLGTTAAPRTRAAPKPAVETPKPAGDAPATTGKTKADLEAEMLKAAGAKAPSKPPAAAKKAEEPKADDVLGGDEAPAAAAEDGLDDVLGTPEAEKPKEITDADLTSAITKKNGEIKAPAKIRELISKNTPEGKAPSAALIPQEKRAEFLANLAKLTA